MNVSATEQIRTPAVAEGPYVAYLVRRETHSSRALAAVVVSLLLVIALVYVVIEAILSLCNKPKLLARPEQMWVAFTQIASTGSRAVVTAIAVVLILVGLWLWGRAFLPGMLGRHSLEDKRAAYIVDDGVLASSIARQVREEASIPPGQVTTGVAARSVEVQITPITGRPINQTAISDSVRATVGALKLHPRPRTKVKIAKEGKVTR